MFGLFKPRTQRSADARASGPADGPASAPRRIVEATLPLVAEELVVDRRRVEGDTVRVDIRTQTTTETVTEALMREAVDVRRVPIDRPVNALPVTRTEGGVTIIPVMRERLVLKKELVLVEEIHITHARDHAVVGREVKLRRQVPEVTRRPASVSATDAAERPLATERAPL